MIAARQSQQRVGRAYAWVILFVLGLLLVLNIVIVVWIEDGANQFELDTGVAWNEFAAAYPSIATSYILTQRLLYLSFAALALFAVVITYFGFRPGHRWAWYAMWLLPATLALTALLTTQSRRPELAIMYAGLALLAVAGLLLPIWRFFGNQLVGGGETA